MDLIKGAIVDEMALNTVTSENVGADDVGFVQAKWLLVGGLVLPKVAPDDVDENDVCDAIAADIGVLREHMECSAAGATALSEKYGAALGKDVKTAHLGAVPEYPKAGGQEGVEFAFAVFGVSEASDFYEVAGKVRADARPSRSLSRRLRANLTDPRCPSSGTRPRSPTRFAPPTAMSLTRSSMC
jgi:hypothetical protein